MTSTVDSLPYARDDSVDPAPESPRRPRRRISPRLIIGETGRLLILVGTMILLFVAYQLWGTGLEEARAQDDLREEFEALIAEEPPREVPDFELEVPDLRPPPPEGEAIANIRIPAVGIDKFVVEGVGITDLRKGPGHYPLTPLPGQPGNASLAGHRTTYGAPFHRLDELDPGDEIFVTTRQGQFTYVVREQLVVRPSQKEVIGEFGDNRLTLTTCHPKYSARQRLVVVADLQGEPAVDDVDETARPVSDDDAEDGLAAEDSDENPATDEDPSTVGVDDDGEPLGEDPATEVPAAEAAPERADSIHLPGDPSERVPSLLWGLASLAVVMAARYVGNRWRRVPTIVVALPVWLAVVWVFFQHLSKAIPQGV